MVNAGGPGLESELLTHISRDRMDGRTQGLGGPPDFFCCRSSPAAGNDLLLCRSSTTRSSDYGSNSNPNSARPAFLTKQGSPAFPRPGCKRRRTTGVGHEDLADLERPELLDICERGSISFRPVVSTRDFSVCGICVLWLIGLPLGASR